MDQSEDRERDGEEEDNVRWGRHKIYLEGSYFGVKQRVFSV